MQYHFYKIIIWVISIVDNMSSSPFNRKVQTKSTMKKHTIEKVMPSEKNSFKKEPSNTREMEDTYVVEAIAAIIVEKWQDAERFIGRLSNVILKKKLESLKNLYRNKIVQDSTLKQRFIAHFDSLNRILNYASSQEITQFPLQMSDKLGQVDVSSFERIIKLANASKVSSLLLRNGKNVNLNSYKGSLTDESMSNLASMEKILSEYSIKKSPRILTQASDKSIERNTNKNPFYVPLSEQKKGISIASKNYQSSNQSENNLQSPREWRDSKGIRYEEDPNAEKNNQTTAFLKNNKKMHIDIKNLTSEKEKQKIDRPISQRVTQKQVLNQNKLFELEQMKLQLQLKDLKRYIATKETEQKSAKKRFEEREHQFAKKEAQYQEQLASYNEKLKGFEKLLQEIRSLEQKLKQTQAHMKSQAQLSSKMVADLNSKCFHLEAQLKQQQTQHQRRDKAEHDRIIRDYQNRLMGLEENVRMFKNENSALAANLRFLDTEIEEKTEKLTQLQAAQKNHEQTINTANNLFEEHKSAWEKERKDHQTQNTKLSKKLNSFLTRNKQLESQCALTKKIKTCEEQSLEQQHQIDILLETFDEATNLTQSIESRFQSSKTNLGLKMESMAKEMNLKDKRILQLSNLNAELRKQSKRSRIKIEKLEESIETEQKENIFEGQI